MNPITQAEIEEAKKIAEAATPGRWEVKSEQDSFDRWWVYGVFSQHGVKHIYNHDRSTRSNSFSGYIAEPAITPAESFQESSKNMEHIAHFNPEFTLRLIADLEEKEKALREAAKVLNRISNNFPYPLEDSEIIANDFLVAHPELKDMK